jgi:hypothetical protein
MTEVTHLARLARTKGRLVIIVAVGFLAGPLPASGEQVAWEFNGTVDEISGSPGISQGEAFRVVVVFDTEAALTGTRTGPHANGLDYSPGARYDYDPSGISVLLGLGSLPDQVILPGGADFLILRDDSGDLTEHEGFGPSDGLTFGLTDDETYFIAVILRGDTTGIFNGGQLPARPDPRLLDLQTKTFEWGTRDEQGIERGAMGKISSIKSVAIPARVHGLVR